MVGRTCPIILEERRQKRSRQKIFDKNLVEVL